MTTNTMNKACELTDRQYKRLSSLIYDSAGIYLGDGKKELVHARLSKIIRKRKLGGFKEYIEQLENDPHGEEITHLLDAISTNVTHFFREEKHFDFLVNHCAGWPTKEPIRIWSAGCSSGEEPYSIAITFFEYILGENDPPPFILATDLSTKVLGKAVSAVYPAKAVEKLDKSLIRRYFLKGKNAHEGMVKVKPHVAKTVTFQRLNLMEPVSFSRGFDIIFCRNVMIYFDARTRQNIINKFDSVLNPGGLLIIGHSESLNGISHGFKYIQPTIYRKP